MMSHYILYLFSASFEFNQRAVDMFFRSLSFVGLLSFCLFVLLLRCSSLVFGLFFCD